MLENLPFGLTQIDAITIMAGVAVFVSVFAVWSTLVSRDPMRGRVKLLQERRDELKAGYTISKKRAGTLKEDDKYDFMRRVVERLKLLQNDQTKKLTMTLARAGYRQQDAIIIFMFAKLVAPVIGAIAAFTLLVGMGVYADDSTKQALIGLGLVIGGFYVPDIFVKNATDNRLEAIRLTLPDALDLLVICAEAGLTLDSALNRVAREMTLASPELSDEFSLTAIELSFLADRRTALNNLWQRVQLPAIRSVVATLIQTEKYGTPLSQSLRVLSSEFRNERMMRAEEKAARLPAIMTIPLILFILPPLFVVLMGPAACDITDSFINR
jgi:tight adherence protein C